MFIISRPPQTPALRQGCSVLHVELDGNYKSCTGAELLGLESGVYA